MNKSNETFDSIEHAIEAIGRGEMVIVVDDEDRENEGDLVMAAEAVTPDDINFMSKQARGLICMPMEQEHLDRLQIPSMVPNNTESLQTGFTVSIDAVDSTTTGISAYDRAKTIQTAIDPETGAGDLRRPGHVFPLSAVQGGVLKRAGHTEAAVDLARCAGFRGGGVICEIMSEDGTMARRPELEEFARDHDLIMITIEDLIRYRRRTEQLVEKVAESRLSTRFGEFHVFAYRNSINDREHLVLARGKIRNQDNVMVRVHSQCLTGDVFGSMRCNCQAQLHRSLQLIQQEEEGILLYLTRAGRAGELSRQVNRFHSSGPVQDSHGPEQDLREYGIGAQILADLGLSTIRLLTNNPRKIIGLKGYGLEVTDQIPIEVCPRSNDEQDQLLDHDNFQSL